jgi:hypothetical protein
MFQSSSTLPRVVKVKSTTPINDDLEVFDMMSRFLASEKAKQLSHDFAGQAYLASSSQIWNDLRHSCNSLLERNDPRREPVAAWKEQIEAVVESVATPIKSEPITEKMTKLETGNANSSEKKSKKKKRKSDSNDDDDKSSVDESSRKKRKAEKKAKKEMKQAKKEKKAAKKAKTES